MKMEHHRDEQPVVPLAECKRRALAYLGRTKQRQEAELDGAAWVANAIWPQHRMKAQGAGAAASRILKHLKNEGLVEWTTITRPSGFWSAGYRLTHKGRATARDNSP